LSVLQTDQSLNNKSLVQKTTLTCSQTADNIFIECPGKISYFNCRGKRVFRKSSWE